MSLISWLKINQRRLCYGQPDELFQELAVPWAQRFPQFLPLSPGCCWPSFSDKEIHPCSLASVLLPSFLSDCLCCVLQVGLGSLNGCVNQSRVTSSMNRSIRLSIHLPGFCCCDKIPWWETTWRKGLTSSCNSRVVLHCLWGSQSRDLEAGTGAEAMAGHYELSCSL